MEKETCYGTVNDLVDDPRLCPGQFSRVGVLNQALRQKLSPAKKHTAALQAKEQAASDIKSIASETVAELLKSGQPDRTLLNKKLTALFQEQLVLYTQSTIPVELRKRQYIARHGLVMSTDNCMTSVLDTLRMRAFVKGIDAALQKLMARLRSQAKTGALHIVYPACGPCAPLLLPLLAYYREQGLLSPADIQVTLIDMQEAAVLNLSTLSQALDVDEYIHAVHCQDATDFQKTYAIHLVVLEAMQHGFSREAHLPIARHFAQLLEPDGEFIPNEVSIKAVLAVGQREYVDQWQSADYCASSERDLAVQAERTELGEIFSVTPQTLRDLNIKDIDEHTSLLECATVKIPESLPQADKQLLMLCSRVKTFADEWIDEYDSGITHPLPDEQVCIDFEPQQSRLGDLLVKRGDTLQFYYRLNGFPGFFAISR